MCCCSSFYSKFNVRKVIRIQWYGLCVYDTTDCMTGSIYHGMAGGAHIGKVATGW